MQGELVAKFAVGVVDTGGKFAAGVVDIGGNMPPVSLTPVANLPPVSLTSVACEYLCEFSKKFEMILLLLSGVRGKVIHEKNLKQKISWHCPINAEFWNDFLFYFVTLWIIEFFLGYLHVLHNISLRSIVSVAFCMIYGFFEHTKEPSTYAEPI